MAARRPAQGCLTPSILRAHFQFITLIRSRMKFSPLSVFFCLSASICLKFWCRWVHCFWYAARVFCSIDKNSNCSGELLMFESQNKNLSKVVPLGPEVCLWSHWESSVRWQLGSIYISFISGWGCSIQADLYLQLLEQLLGFLVALENNVFLLVASVVKGEEKVWVKCRKLGNRNEEKDKLQKDGR